MSDQRLPDGRRTQPRVRFSLRSALMGIAVLAAVFGAIRYYVDATTPRVKILCDKPDARLYFRDRFQGMLPAIFTEARAKRLIPEYDETVLKWHRGSPSRQREIDLRNMLSDHMTSWRGFWIPLEAGDEKSYHYRETPWGLALGATGVGSDSVGLHLDLLRRDASTVALIESWTLLDKPVTPSAICKADVRLGPDLSVDSINTSWRLQIHYSCYEQRSERTRDPEDVRFEPNKDPGGGPHRVSFSAPKDPGHYHVGLWLYAIPADPRGNCHAADYEMLTVSSDGQP
jgi:hypothetical protein